jgi:hypothetical protein
VEDVVHHAWNIDSDKAIAGALIMKFSLGSIVWTRGINDRIAVDTLFAKFVMESLKRHSSCDWGELSAEDKRENDFSLDKGLRLLSSYQRNDDRIWIITEADRSVTTILFPEEY